MADEPKDPDFTPVSFMSFGNQDIPAFVEVKNKDYVLYGEKNDYPNYLIDLYTQSAYHKAIVDGKVSYICGAGWNVDTTGLTLEEKAKALNMLKQPMGIQDLDLSTLSWSKDAELFNGICVVVSWSKDQKSCTLRYIDMANIRTNPMQDQFYYTAKWFKTNPSGQRAPNNKPHEEPDWMVYPKYDPDNRVGEQIYYWKEHHPDQKVYPLPVYAGAVTWINVDVDLAKYFYHTVGNAFVPTHLINFYNGEPTEEKMRKVESKIKEKWTSPTGNRIIVNFAQNKESSADVHTLQMTDADKQYEAVRKYSEQAIFTGHRVTSPMLFGIKTEGQLGGRSELAFAEEHFQNSYIRQRQIILENIINKIAGDIGIKVKFYLNKVRRVGYAFDATAIDSVLTPEEKRQYVLEQLGIVPDMSVDVNPATELRKILSSLSPLLANKILESMSPGEIRDMVGLSSEPVSKVTVTTTTEFSAHSNDDDLIEKFASIAHDADYEVLSEKCIDNFGKSEIGKSEQELLAGYHEFALKVSTLQRSIIDLLTKDATTQPEAIAKATGSTVENVSKAIENLVSREIIKPQQLETNGQPAKAYEVSEKAVEIIEEDPAKTETVKVVYRYGLAPRFKGEKEIIPTSRKFCREMIALSNGGKRWTSEAIFSLDPGDDINPWTQRGGWYTIPGTDTHVSVCRHAWVQQLVKVKGNG